MQLETEDRTLLRVQAYSVLILAAVATAVSLSYTKSVMVPFVLAALFSFLAHPLINLMTARLKLPRSLAIVLLFVGTGLVIVLLGAIFANTASNLMTNIDQYKVRVQQLVEISVGLLHKVGIDVSQADIGHALGELPFFDYAKGLLVKVSTMASNSLLIAIFVMFMLAGEPWQIRKESTFGLIGRQLRSYMVTKVLTSLATGVLTLVILEIMGMDMAVLFGFIAFILNFIPTVGSVIAVVLPLPIAILQFDSAVSVVLVILLPSLVQMVIGNIIEPRIMGRDLDLHPVTIMMALLFWGLIWGVSGMILATPIAVMAKILLEKSSWSQPLARLMSGRFQL